MSDRVPIPARVEEAIGYNAWTALSWALQHRWIQDYKWLFSEINKNEIGTPYTVRIMLDLSDLMSETNQFYTFSEETDRSDYQKIGTRGLFMFSDRVEPERASEFYKLMVEGYLLGTDFVSPLWVMKPNGKWLPSDLEQTGVVQDEHGANQLEGELRRYWAQKRGIKQIKEIRLTDKIIDDYCAYFGLNGISDRLAERLTPKSHHI
jgi:hypothetical protein